MPLIRQAAGQPVMYPAGQPIRPFLPQPQFQNFGSLEATSSAQGLGKTWCRRIGATVFSIFGVAGESWEPEPYAREVLGRCLQVSLLLLLPKVYGRHRANAFLIISCFIRLEKRLTRVPSPCPEGATCSETFFAQRLEMF